MNRVAAPLKLAAPGAAASPLADGDELSPAQRRATVAGILALHAVAGWGLLQVQAVRDAVRDVAPVFVSMVAPQAAPVPPPVAPPPPPPPRPQPVRVQPLPLLAATTPSPAPAPFVVPPPPPEPAPPLAAPAPTPPAPVAVAAAPAAAPVPPPPKLIPASAVHYLEPPSLVYPPLSIRNREQGRVVVRAFIGTAGGAPRSVQVESSSRFARLDDAAVAAVQKARFQPYTENGQPVEGWVLIPFNLELEK